MKFNPSMLKTWMACPLQARFKEIEKRPFRQNAKASFGTCIHDALEQFNTYGNVDSAIERFKLTWANPEMLGVEPSEWSRGQTYPGLRDKGLEILTGYAEAQVWDSRRVIATEHKFCIPFGDHEISGIVDLIEQKRSGRGKNVLRIVDYKTNTAKPTKFALAMDVQFTTYVFASLQPEFWMGMTSENGQEYPGMANGEQLYEEYMNVERRAIWYHLWTQQELDAGERDDEDFMRMYQCVKEIAKACEAKVFVPNISADSCLWCSYRDICGAVIPVQKHVDEENERKNW